MSKLILRHSVIPSIIVEAVLRSDICPQYTDRSTEWPNGQCSDVLFATVEVTAFLPPVLVEVQNTIDLKFIQRVVRYCLAIKKEHGHLPVVVAFGIHPTNPNVATDLTPSSSLPYAREYPCKPWVRYIYILDQSSVSNHMHEQPLKPLVAVEYFLHSQKRSLLSMENKGRTDETIMLLYTIAKQIFEDDVKSEERTIDVLLNVCEQMQKQFFKIKDALALGNGDETKKRVREYAEDGRLYLEACKAKYRRISLPEPLDLPEQAKKDGPSAAEYAEDLLPSSDQPNDQSPDFEFVENFRKNEKRMNWSSCFNAGRAKGLLGHIRTLIV
ncbi:hypothetical protein A0J61_09577 [Choanephora cucurbitarum]|uniref:Uncharacterized protein n=1 Tax=Choanephora cucurbitarum TaxID=101091 RepID=A0A1C7N4W7_9FUNG|nr:hypothetical protein A0J61_09577 [Choanephora cucurbitarum]